MQLTFSFGLSAAQPFPNQMCEGGNSDMEHLNIFLKSHDYEISDNCIEKAINYLVKTPTANLFVSILLFVMLHI